jgi:hypothetical protein
MQRLRIALTLPRKPTTVRSTVTVFPTAWLSIAPVVPKVLPPGGVCIPFLFQSTGSPSLSEKGSTTRRAYPPRLGLGGDLFGVKQSEYNNVCTVGQPSYATPISVNDTTSNLGN